MADRDINIGGDSIGSSNVTGDNNVVSNTYTNITLPAPESVDMGATIADLRAALSDLLLKQGDHAKIAESLEAAEQEAKSDNPDRQSIGEHVERALNIANGAGDFVDTCKKLAPHVASATSWLGENWHKVLLPIIGFAVG